MCSRFLDRIFHGWRTTPLARATISSWLASGSVVALGLFRTKINATTLGSTGVGIIAQANTLSAWIGSLAMLGLSTGCIRAIAAARARHDEREVTAVAHFGTLVPLTLAVVLAAVAVLFSTQATRFLLGDPALRWIVVLAAMSVPLNVLTGSISTVLQGEERISRYARISATAATVNTILVVGLVLTMQIRGAAIALLLTSLAGAAVSVVVAPDAAVKTIRTPIHFPSRAVILTIVKLGIASFVLGAAGTTTDLLIRNRIVGLLGVRGVGEYQPAFAFSNQYLLVFINAIGVYLFPTLTRLLESGDRPGAEKELNAGIRMMLLVFTPLVILLALAAPVVVRALYSDEFGNAVPVLRIQLVGDLLKVCAYSFGAMLLPLRFVKWWAAIGLGTVGLNVAIAWILLPTAHLPAVGLGYSASWVLNLGLTVLVLWRADRKWLMPRNVLLSCAAILSVTGVVAATAIVPGAASLFVGGAVLAAWTWRALHAVLGWLRSGRNGPCA